LIRQASRTFGGRGRSRPAPLDDLLAPEDTERAERVAAKLAELAPLWQRLPVDGELVFTWPSTVPCFRHRAPAGRRGVC
jgi:hypothetical protein